MACAAKMPALARPNTATTTSIIALILKLLPRHPNKRRLFQDCSAILEKWFRRRSNRPPAGLFRRSGVNAVSGSLVPLATAR
jgi:hypothetical protein